MPERKRLLVVDDNRDMLAELVPLLQGEGYEVETATSGREALQKCESRFYDLMVLDVLMPSGIDGREVLRQLREKDNRILVIMLTEINDVGVRARTYNEGADDYIDKPYDIHDLLARIKRRLQSQYPKEKKEAQRLRSGNMVLDRIERKVWLNDKEVKITPRAFDMLAMLMQHAPAVVTHNELLNWKLEDDLTTHAVTQRILELRKVLGDDMIETSVGRGYRFCGRVQAE